MSKSKRSPRATRPPRSPYRLRRRLTKQSACALPPSPAAPAPDKELVRMARGIVHPLHIPLVFDDQIMSASATSLSIRDGGVAVESEDGHEHSALLNAGLAALDIEKGGMARSNLDRVDIGQLTRETSYTSQMVKHGLVSTSHVGKAHIRIFAECWAELARSSSTKIGVNTTLTPGRPQLALLSGAAWHVGDKVRGAQGTLIWLGDDDSPAQSGVNEAFGVQIVRDLGGGKTRVEKVMQMTGPIRNVNSSCDPNCVIVRGTGFGDTVSKVHLKAIKEIQEGEELTFDYGEEYFKARGIKCACPPCQLRSQINDIPIPPTLPTSSARISKPIPGRRISIIETETSSSPNSLNCAISDTDSDGAIPPLPKFSITPFPRFKPFYRISSHARSPHLPPCSDLEHDNQPRTPSPRRQHIVWRSSTANSPRRTPLKFEGTPPNVTKRKRSKAKKFALSVPALLEVSEWEEEEEEAGGDHMVGRRCTSDVLEAMSEGDGGESGRGSDFGADVASPLRRCGSSFTGVAVFHDAHAFEEDERNGEIDDVDDQNKDYTEDDDEVANEGRDEDGGESEEDGDVDWADMNLDSTGSQAGHILVKVEPGRGRTDEETEVVFDEGGDSQDGGEMEDYSCGAILNPITPPLSTFPSPTPSPKSYAVIRQTPSTPLTSSIPLKISLCSTPSLLHYSTIPSVTSRFRLGHPNAISQLGLDYPGSASESGSPAILKVAPKRSALSTLSQPSPIIPISPPHTSELSVESTIISIVNLPSPHLLAAVSESITAASFVAADKGLVDGIFAPVAKYFGFW